MNYSEKKYKIFPLNLQNIEFNFFLLGVLFLASAPFISCLIFIYPAYKGLLDLKININKDSNTQVFLIVSIILILKSIFSIFNVNNQIGSWTYSLNWAGITNWIPLFIFSIGLNKYLNDSYKRKLVSKFLIIGTIPVLISCVGQYWFKWYGPFEILNGLITWFQKPLSDNNQNVTGLFSNPNYSGLWLTMMWPLSIAIMKEKIHFKEFLKSKIMFIIVILITSFTILTNSRNAWIGLFISIPIFLGKKSLRWYLPLILTIVFVILASFLPFIPKEIKDISEALIPENIGNKFSEIILNFDTFPRIDIWSNAIQFILQKPLFGWGADSFPILYNLKTGIWNNHTHNLFLELSVSYGIIVASLIYFVYIKTLIRSYNNIFMKRSSTSICDRGWWIAFLIFFLSHLYDVLIFDIRINLASWIFLIGLKNIIINPSENYSSNSLN